jgi:MFS family permease
VADLKTTVPDVQLAITAYTLVMAAFMLTGAKLGDIWGRRKALSIVWRSTVVDRSALLLKALTSRYLNR